MLDGIDTLTTIPETAADRPGIYRSYVDPGYGDVIIRRITDQAGSGHHYSKDPPWSQDESLIFVSRPGGDLFLDGTNYKPAFRCEIPGDARWIGPDVMLYIAGGKLGKIWPRTGKREVIRDFGRDLMMGPHEGRPTENGRMVVLVDEAAERAFAYDVGAKKAWPEFSYRAGWDNSDWLSISPLGKYIVQAGQGGRRMRVWTLDGKLLPGEFVNIKHADVGLDQDGNEIIVGIKNSQPDDGHVYKLSIPDLKPTRLTPNGWGYGSHASLTALGRQRWALITTASKTPTRNELVLVALDGSEQIRRFGKFRSSGAGYVGEPHGALSPYGDRVMFRSNWGSGGASSVNGYVIETPTYHQRIAGGGEPQPPVPEPKPAADLMVPRAVVGSALDIGLDAFAGEPVTLSRDEAHARFWLGWTPDALHVGAFVAASDILGGGQPWQQDSVEVFVGGPENQTIVTALGRIWPDGSAVTARVRHRGKAGYEVVMQIPWPGAVMAGNRVPVQLALNDVRADGKISVSWTGEPLNKTEPFKIIELVE